MMKLVFVLVSSYLVTASGRRILGGTDANIEQFPYQISLERDGEHICGGSILSQTKILTAAHCFRDFGYEFKVRAGSSLKERGGQLMQIARKHIHPHYNYDILRNDIAVLILAKPLKFNKYVQPIQLSSETGPYIYASGWGYYSHSKWGETANRLQMVMLPTVSDETCSMFRHFDRNTMACYGGVTGRNTCHADSGGPITVNGKLVGVVCFGADYCMNPYISGYTKVSVFLDFINSAN